MKTTLIAAAASGAVLLGSLALPAAASPGDATSTDVVVTPAMAPIPDVPLVIPVVTCARSEVCGAGFTVTLTDANGVRRTTTTGTGAGAMFLGDGLAAPIAVQVKVSRVAGHEATLRGFIADDLRRGTGINLVSTVAAAIADESGMTPKAAMAKAKYGMRIPADATFSQITAGVSDFSAGSFLARARKQGGVNTFINEVVVPKILDGKRFNFSGNRRAVQPRSAIPLTDSILKAAGADSDLSDFLGLPDPAKEIKQAMDELVTAITEGFTMLAAMITALMREEQETQYQNYVQTLSSLTSATVNDVEQMQFLSYMNLQDDTDIATYGYYREQLYNDIAENVSGNENYGLYEPTLLYNVVPGSEGLLQAGVDMATATQNFYVAEDVDNVQGLVEYWSSMAAASNFLLVNAMSIDPDIPDASRATVMQNQNNTAAALNDNVMLAMPEDLGSDEVGSWQANEAYTIVGAKNVPYKTMTQMAKWGSADCGNFKTTSSSGVSGVTFDSQAEIQQWWTDMAQSVKSGSVPVYGLGTGTQAANILTQTRYDAASGTSSNAQQFLQGVAGQMATVPRAAVTSDTIHVLGRRDADNKDGGYKGAKLCTAIDMNPGSTGINVEIKYDKANSINTTAFASRPAQLSPNWAGLK